ncbi:MAG: OmpH family outer membrane protein [Planctomycetota bacterium]|nr:MAG: OmpH family outer membrane protein [Planctomycetota bacterium]
MKNFNIQTVVIAALVAFGLGSFAWGVSRPVAPAQATRVGSLNLAKVLDKLQEKSDWEAQLGALQNQMRDEADSRKKKLEAEVKQAASATDGAEQQRIAEQVVLEQLQLEQWATLKGGELDLENSLMWQSIYRHLREESAKLAESEDYDYIIVNDGTNEIMTSREAKVPLSQQVLEQIGRRHIIFASPSTDISDKLIVRMNNTHATAPASVGPAKK